MSKQQKKGKASKKKRGSNRPQLAEPPKWLSNYRLNSLLLFFCCVLLYANTCTHDYTQDDAIVLYDNMFVTQGIEGFGGILSKDTFFGFFKEEGKANLVSGGRYRPLTLLQFATGWELFGDTPLVFHLMNILWYAFCCVLLYWFLLRLLNTKKNRIELHFIALAASLLFATHPIHTEVVANIKGRDEIMTLVGSLAATYFVLRSVDSNKFIWQLPAALCFFLGILAKENAITFLAIIPLAVYFFRDKNLGHVLVQSLPIFATAGLYLLLRFSIFSDNPEPKPILELMNNPFLKVEAGKWVALNFSEWSATILFTLGKYLQLLFFPHPLTHDYYPRHIEVMNWSDWQVLTSFLIYLALGVYALLRLPKKDPISFGVIFYLATLSIVSNIVFPIGTNMGERFAFLPSIGFCFIMAVLFWRLAKQLGTKQQLQSMKQLRIPLLLVGLITVLFSIKTITRNFVWKDNFTLFTTDIYHSPNSAKLRNGVAGVLIDRSQAIQDVTAKKNLLLEAKGHATVALKIYPTYKNAFLLLGNAHLYLNEYTQAVAAYEKGLTYYPTDNDLNNNAAIAYREAGREQGEQLGNIQQSIQYLEKGFEKRPDDVELLRLLGIAYGINGNTPQAIKVLERATGLAPNNASILFNLGAAYGAAGNSAKAQELFAKAKAIDPSIGGG